MRHQLLVLRSNPSKVVVISKGRPCIEEGDKEGLFEGTGEGSFTSMLFTSAPTGKLSSMIDVLSCKALSKT